MTTTNETQVCAEGACQTRSNSRKCSALTVWLSCLLTFAGAMEVHAASRQVTSGAATATANIASTLEAPTVSLAMLSESARVGGYSVLMITLTNPNSDIFSGEIDGLQFTVNYPTPLHIATAVNAPQPLLDNTCGTLAFPPPNQPQTSFSLTDGAIAAGSSCVVALTVVGTTVGASTIHTGPVTSANASPGADATASLTIVPGALLSAPTAQNALSPSIIASGGTSQMTIRLTNTDVSNAVTGVSITEFIYPPNIENAASGALVRNTCGGLLSLRTGNPDYDLRLLNATISAGGTCDVIVNVVGLDPQSTCLSDTCTGQTFTDPLVSGNAQWGNSASATITVRSDPLLSPPTVTEAFVPNVVAVGTPSKMQIHLANANGSPITGAQFTDSYPAGIANAVSGVVDSNTCGGTLTAGANDQFAALANGTIPAGGFCDVVLNVVGLAEGVWVNQTGPIASGNASTANTTFAGLNVDAGPPSSDLTLTKSHAGNFSKGQTGATYTLLVHNVGNLATNGPVAVADTLPAGLSIETIAGSGWNCTTATATCARSDALAPGADYPPITLTVDVASDAPSSVTNTAAVSGGAEVNLSNDAASDPTAITVPMAPATLTIVNGNSQSAVINTAFAQPLVVKVADIAQNAVPGVTVTFTPPVGGASASCLPAPPTDGSGLTQTTCIANGSVGTYAVSASINDPNIDIAPVAFTLANVTVAAPDLVLGKSHAGNFTKGQTGAVYSLIVNNAGSAPSTGMVSVTDALPAQMTLTALDGPGWACSLASKTCTRSNALAAGASYPAITVTVDVAANAPSSLINTASVSGGGETNTANDTASDPTTIDAASAGPDMTLTKNHAGDFSQGQFGAVYSLIAHNIGAGPTNGEVTVADTLPAALTATAISGPGWACSLATTSCTRSDVLASGASYPAITLTVGVAADAPALLVNAASASGGGETNSNNDAANDPTTIDSASAGPDVTLTKSHAGNFSRGQIGALYTLVAHNVGGASTSGTMTVMDTLPAALVATAMSGPGWTCNVAIVSCTRNDALPAAGSYPAISLSVNVAANAPAAVLNTAVVSGGGETNANNDAANDPTSIDAASAVADLTLSKTHIGNFHHGQGGAQYTLIAHNAGAAATFGTVTVADALPGSLTPTAMSGQGWTCDIGTTTCTRSDSLASGADYPPIALTIDVAANAPPSVTNTATASGGGETNPNNDAASDFTAIDSGVLPQTITFTSVPPANATVGGPTYLATATSTSGLAVALTIDATSDTVCTINNGVVTLIGAGTCMIDANQGGNSTFAPAPQVQQPFAVASGGGGNNHAPVAVDDAILVAPHGSSNVLVGDIVTPSRVLDNDVDPDGDALTASKLAGPSHGDLTLNANGSFNYQNHLNDPATSDSFTYSACDTHSVCDVGTVTITIGDGLDDHVPFATDDAIQVAHDASTGSLIGDPNATDSVLDNDIDPDGQALTAAKLTDPSHGDLSFSADGTFAYQNHVGDPASSDAFLYSACDSFGACSLGVVSITIGNGPPDHLPIVVDDAMQVARGQSVQTLIGDPADPGSVLDNDHDPDQGDMLTAGKASPLLDMSGSLSFNADGTFSYQNLDQQATTDSFIYEACDTFHACTAGIVTISINNDPPDAAPTTANDTIIVAPQSSTSVLVGGATSVLANDTDPGDTLTAQLISAPANGHVTLNAYGTFTYYNDDPAPGDDNWAYEACDSEGACTEGTVSVTVDGSAPTVTCVLPSQLYVVGDAVSIDLSLLFAPPAGQTLTYSATNVPPSLTVAGSLLTGTLQAIDAPPSPPYAYGSTLSATTVGSGVGASENVTLQVLPTGEILLRNGFDAGATAHPCQ